MAGTQGETVRVGIAGLDHWYIGLDAARAASDHPDVELVVVAHRDAARAEETARRFGAGSATTAYAAVAARDDLDILVTACRTSENADLCVEAARHGTHIVSVKPIALTREDARRIKDAVTQAGVRFFSWESTYRLDGRYRQLKSWIDAGKFGRLVSAAHLMHSTLPAQEWPGVQGHTWWLDPRQVPGGGWIDHSIYTIDALRWLFGSEVATVGGVTARLVHQDIAADLEDFGQSTLTFAGAQAASLEVTWTGAPGAFIARTHLAGTEGAIVIDSTTPGRVLLSGNFEPFQGWTSIALPQSRTGPIDAMVAALRGETPLPAGVDDACRNLDVCLTFYEAAREGRFKEVAY